MIFDSLENVARYQAVGQRISRAFAYLQSTDLIALTPGRYDIDGEDIFAVVSSYATLDRAKCELEGHQRFIDLQYMVAGSEWLGYAPLRNQPPSITHPPEDDCQFYQGDASFVLLDQGMFALLFPTDLHMPCIRAAHPLVKKVVVKIRA